MKKDSKSGLCIKKAIASIIVVIIISITIQPLVINKNMEIADKKNTDILQENNINNETKEELQIAQTNERQIQTTTRALNERTIENYIKIDEIVISKDMDLTKRCGVSKEDFKTMLEKLKSDTSNFFKNNSNTIYDICKKYELNEIFFCGLIVAEAGWNISSSHRNANNYISMMSKGKLICYSSEEEGLEAAAKLLHNQYLTESGSFYNGKTLSDVKKVFCPNSSTWVNLVYNCMEQMVN